MSRAVRGVGGEALAIESSRGGWVIHEDHQLRGLRSREPGCEGEVCGGATRCRGGCCMYFVLQSTLLYCNTFPCNAPNSDRPPIHSPRGGCSPPRALSSRFTLAPRPTFLAPRQEIVSKP